MRARLAAAALAAAATTTAALCDLLTGRDPAARAQPTPAQRSEAAERILLAEAAEREQDTARRGH